MSSRSFVGKGRSLEVETHSSRSLFLGNSAISTRFFSASLTNFARKVSLGAACCFWKACSAAVNCWVSCPKPLLGGGSFMSSRRRALDASAFARFADGRAGSGSSSTSSMVSSSMSSVTRYYTPSMLGGDGMALTFVGLLWHSSSIPLRRHGI